MATVRSPLAPGGALSAALPDYEDRPEQQRMAHAVARALAEDRPLLVEAGTGTGKTLAYLLAALESGRKVVVSTGTRTLQDQIVRHDIEVARQVVDRPFVAVVLKGIGNYLCRRRLAELNVSTAASGGPPAPQLEMIQAWARETIRGDRAELAALPEESLAWSAVTTTAEGRLGPRCPHFAECYVTRARREADDADLVIVNHHLFFADLALRSAFPGARALPDYEAVVFDEAHQIEDVATSYFGISLSAQRINRLMSDATRALCRPRGPSARAGEAARRLVAHASAAWQRFLDRIHTALQGAAVAEMPRAATARDRGGATGLSPRRLALPADLFESETVREAWFAADTAADELGCHAELSAQATDAKDDREDLAALARRLRQLRDDVATVADGCNQDADATYVHWAEMRREGAVVKASPIEVGRLLGRHLFDHVPAVVLTSATLSTPADDKSPFAYARARLGVDEFEPLELHLESPFDYRRQTLLYLPTDLPEPSAEDFPPRSCQRIVECLAVTQGRAFVLFTTHKALRAAARQLAIAVDYPLLIQGAMTRGALLDEFRRRPGAVLLATSSFWEGVDMPGEALSHVIIDKLPFAPPDDPVVAARSRLVAARGGDPFLDYQVPRAALALKQGFGRLIRRRQDRGIVSILDRRVLARRYGERFVATLPADVSRTSSLEQVRRWWNERVEETR